MRAFAAPGKLMIAGEYSVLGPDGVALAVAVEPGIEAVVRPAALWSLGRADGPMRWTEGASDVHAALAFAHAALELARERLGPLPPHHIETRLPSDTATGPRKPGVGGSAGAAAVVTGALFGLAGRDLAQQREAVLELALAAHTRVQGGGSGYDVATVVHGGAVCWERVAGHAERLDWPDGLGFIAGYSGKSARTSRQLERLARARQRHPDSVAGELAALNREVSQLVDAWRTGEAPAILAAVARCHDRLERWDRRRKLGIVTPAIAEMIGLAGECGAAAKVSGAGAGDSVIALGPPAELEAAAAAWRGAGFAPLTVSVSSAGLREL